jgi:hypothetical protein
MQMFRVGAKAYVPNYPESSYSMAALNRRNNNNGSKKSRFTTNLKAIAKDRKLKSVIEPLLENTPTVLDIVVYLNNAEVYNRRGTIWTVDNLRAKLRALFPDYNPPPAPRRKFGATTRKI